MHSCPICETYHWKVRASHGILIQEVRDAMRFVDQKMTVNASSWYRRKMKELVYFENAMGIYDRLARQRDRWDASYKGNKNKMYHLGG